MLPDERWPWLAVSALGPALPRVTPEANRASGAEEPQPRSRRLVLLGSATFDGEGDAGEARRSGDRRIYVVLSRTRLGRYAYAIGSSRTSVTLVTKENGEDSKVQAVLHPSCENPPT
jgi:hypothetical protein